MVSDTVTRGAVAVVEMHFTIVSGASDCNWVDSVAGTDNDTFADGRYPGWVNQKHRTYKKVSA
jgi:hypothetical protein